MKLHPESFWTEIYDYDKIIILRDNSYYLQNPLAVSNLRLDFKRCCAGPSLWCSSPILRWTLYGRVHLKAAASSMLVGGYQPPGGCCIFSVTGSGRRACGAMLGLVGVKPPAARAPILVNSEDVALPRLACWPQPGKTVRWPVDSIEAQWKGVPLVDVVSWDGSPGSSPRPSPPSAVTPSTTNRKRLILHSRHAWSSLGGGICCSR